MKRGSNPLENKRTQRRQPKAKEKPESEFIDQAELCIVLTQHGGLKQQACLILTGDLTPAVFTSALGDLVQQFKTKLEL